MNINRDNYEMFFLLYVDNELSATERKTVEDFAESNPDLGIELSILKETVLPADTVSFGNKNDLFRSSEKEELQEQMLLYLDNELTDQEKIRFEKNLSRDEGLQEEWKILQQTKLDRSESIVFPGKRSLYRHERGRVIAMRFTRLAIAAVFIGAGLFFGYNLLQKDSNPVTITPVASNINNQKPSSTSTQLPNIAQSTTNSIAIPNVENEKIHIAQSPKVKPVVPGVEANATVASKEPQIKVIKKESPAVTEPETRLMAMTNPNKSMEKISPERTSEEMEMAKLNRVNRPSVTDVNLAAVDNSIARTAGITNLEEPDDDKILYVDEDKLTRTKAAGFLRKLKRTVERNTRIKTGNGVRIAGFEFAVK